MTHTLHTYLSEIQVEVDYTVDPGDPYGVPPTRPEAEISAIRIKHPRHQWVIDVPTGRLFDALAEHVDHQELIDNAE